MIAESFTAVKINLLRRILLAAELRACEERRSTNGEGDEEQESPRRQKTDASEPNGERREDGAMSRPRSSTTPTTQRATMMHSAQKWRRTAEQDDKARRSARGSRCTENDNFVA